VRRAWSLLLIALVATGAAPAAYRGNPSDTDPAWSPDGRWIAFVHDADSGNSTSARDLVLVTPTGREQHLVVRGVELDSHQPYSPEWSPDGRTILFGTCCDPDRVYTFALDGSRLTRIATVGREPTWSPDGTKVAFVGERSFLTSANVDGSDARRLAPDASQPDWSPDGAEIAFTSEGDVYVWNVAGARAVRLTSTPQREAFPRWSPDGALISFTRGPDYFVMQADGSQRRRVARTWQDDPYSSPGPASWSPDGRRLALVARAPVPKPVGLVTDAIAVVRPDGRALRLLTAGSNASEAQPTWSPDGRSVAFSGAPPCPTVREGIGIVKLPRRRVEWATQNCFIYGSAKSDRLSGTPDGDVIYGFRGDDRIFAGPGEDVLQGGRGDDRLDGGERYDDICDEWCDIMRGGPGDDGLQAHDTPSYIDGGLGHDRLTGSSRADSLDGGRGSDVVRGGRGEDVIHAQDGVVDSIACGPNQDAVLADPLDRVAADCEYVRRRSRGGGSR
jgi:Tol biopolymer transport system component